MRQGQAALQPLTRDLSVSYRSALLSRTLLHVSSDAKGIAAAATGALAADGVRRRAALLHCQVNELQHAVLVVLIPPRPQADLDALRLALPLSLLHGHAEFVLGFFAVFVPERQKKMAANVHTQSRKPTNQNHNHNHTFHATY